MRLRLTVAAMLLIASGPAVAQAWELQQNDPNPFCNDPSDTGPRTEIRIDADTGVLLFEDTKIATILCEPTPARDVTWGSIKATYRD